MCTASGALFISLRNHRRVSVKTIKEDVIKTVYHFLLTLKNTVKNACEKMRFDKRIARTHDPVVTLSQNGYGEILSTQISLYPIMTFSCFDVINLCKFECTVKNGIV